MRKLFVPRGKCPLDFLADLGEETRNSWIFLHESVVRDLEGRVDLAAGDSIRKFIDDVTWLMWPETEEYPMTSIIWRSDRDSGWARVIEIRADDIAFRDIPKDPEDILLLKMAE